LRSSDVTKLVATGYDQIADSYLQRFGHSAVRARKLIELAEPSCQRALMCSILAVEPACR
jgi:hypothetical protein